MAGQPKTDRVPGAIATLDKVRRQWLRREGVTAVDVGLKISNGEITDTVALRVHVARKRPGRTPWVLPTPARRGRRGRRVCAVARSVNNAVLRSCSTAMVAMASPIPERGSASLWRGMPSALHDGQRDARLAGIVRASLLSRSRTMRVSSRGPGITTRPSCSNSAS
jgi:hypothetical protein